MVWQFTPYFAPLIVTCSIALSLTIVLWRRRSAPGALPLALLMLAVALWAAAYALNLSSANLAAQLFWSSVTYVGIIVVPVCWFAFALQYTQRGGWLTRAHIALLAVIPITSVVLVWTNQAHQLFQTNVQSVQFGSVSLLTAQFGPGFWMHAAYSYLLLTLGAVILLRYWLAAPQLYRQQVGVLVLGLSAPWISNILHLAGLDPFPNLDLTPFALTFTGLVMVWDVLRFGLFDLVPVARNSVVESMHDSVLVLDTQNRIVDINPAAVEALNQPASALVGQQITHVIANRQDLLDQYLDVVQLHTEITSTRTGNEQVYELRISPIYDRRNTLTGRVVVLHNITERKQTARALAQAKNDAEVANIAKSRFLANMSHELRTPLTAILGYSELIHEQVREQGYHEMLDDIEQVQAAGEHLLHLIKDILDFTQLESGGLDLQIEAFSVADLIDDIGTAITPHLQRNDNTLEIKCADNTGVIYTDRTRVHQALWQLIDNAAKFTEAGTVTIAAEREQHPDGDWLVFQVADTGIGIAPEHQQQLFHEFSQADDSTTRRFGGSGLGLVISQRLCWLLGGDIDVASDLGRGTTCTVQLPARAETRQHRGAHSTSLPLTNIEYNA